MRSVLFALGISCLILGVQSLVVDHAVLKNQRPFAGLRRAAFQQPATQFDPNYSQLDPNYSQLDPNYFNGPFSNNAATGYGYNSNARNSPFQVAGYQQPSSGPFAGANPLAGSVSTVGARRIFKPLVWMPWGFFVAGFLFLLFSKRSHHE